MKYVKQFAIILAVTCIGEVLKYFLPFLIPASVYGLIVLLVLLVTGLVKLDQVQEVGEFLVEIMPVMFIPAAVGLTECWGQMKEMLLPLVVIVPVTTVVVMVCTGKATDAVIAKKRTVAVDGKEGGGAGERE